ncbi:dUTP diphosphatase [Anaerococcus sp.]|jgi:dUTP diphosphatase|uniref:dUTP diphosphatase n=1 Tax=Anaerococcus TaxID=165779 RepID=UPI0025836105|nr:dUTP diphosphatase [Anaerococcus sp.]MDU1829544.1 dUTP diphosphatase [Anaerococcus sp.]MDU1863954.1 dUTP diphosphatase [Anaerococcus sp.]MDU2354645.1 dUTP diphosphatase [Anaerococcus sp.]MDU3211312.1 dUTP diphosphatase [Anaerococcus sp.]
MNEKLKIVYKDNLPAYQTKGAAGLDLHCKTDKNIVIEPKKTVKIDTGIKVQIPEGYFGAIYPRSSTGVKKKIMLANTVGIIDSDYRGEIMIYLYNYGEEEQTIENGDRIAQLIVQPYKQFEIEVVDSLDDTDRGEGGFGSTGK